MTSPRRRGFSVWAVPALYGAAAVYLSLVLLQGFQVVDEGVALMGAWRLSAGEVPGREFFEIVPPLSFLPTAALFKVAGPSLLVARLLAAAYGLCLMALTDALARRLALPLAARLFALAFLVPFGAAYWLIPSHHWVADLACLGAALCLLRAAEGGTVRSWAFGGGALTAAALLSLQDQGSYFAAAVALLFVPCLPKPLRFRLATGWVLGVLCAAAAVGLWLLPTAGPGALVEQWLLFPMGRYAGIAGNEGWGAGALAALRGLAGLAGHGEPLLYQVVHIAAVLALLAVPFLALFGVTRALWEGSPAERAPLALLAGLCLAHAGAALHRPSLTNLVWALPPLLVAAGLPARAGEGRATGSALAWSRTLGGMALLPLALAGAFAVRTQVEPRTVVTTPAGVLWVRSAPEGLSLQQTVDAINRLVPVGAPLFCRTPVPLVGFLARRPNPTRFNLFVYPGYQTDAHAEEVRSALVARPEAWVLETGPPQSGTDLDRFLALNYAVVWDEGYARLLRRRVGGTP